MDYRIEIWDTWGRRLHVFNDVPLVRATMTLADEADVIEGILPAPIADLSHDYVVKAFVDGSLFGEAQIVEVLPQWSDTRKLILERFVKFHEVVEFRAERPARDGNTQVTRTFVNRTVDEMVKALVNAAPGRVHYRIAHGAYPAGAARENQKFLDRKTPASELEVGGIASGQWVDSGRIDSTGAVAVDGSTIGGLKVDGIAWPDLRLMLVNAEEVSRNVWAAKRHPEVVAWTSAQYDLSAFKASAEAAKDFLQSLIDTKGIDFIELNPHRDVTGAYDFRVETGGEYIGLVYGGGECFNAGVIENGHSTVDWVQDGTLFEPDMELKDYFSYGDASSESVEASIETLESFEPSGGLFEGITALAYAAEGWIWSVDEARTLHFRDAARPDHVVFFDPVEHAVALGSNSEGVTNWVDFEANPVISDIAKSFLQPDSLDEYGTRARDWSYFAVAKESVANKIVLGMLKDVAYPESSGGIVFLNGAAGIRPGDLVEVRNPPLRRLEREAPQEWDGRFQGKFVGRAKSVRHEFDGARVSTVVRFTSPLRSVGDPMSFIVRSQPSASAVFSFGLDQTAVGLDLGFHLD